MKGSSSGQPHFLQFSGQGWSLRPSTSHISGACQSRSAYDLPALVLMKTVSFIENTLLHKHSLSFGACPARIRFPPVTWHIISSWLLTETKGELYFSKRYKKQKPRRAGYYFRPPGFKA